MTRQPAALNRRTLLKAAAVTAVGAQVFLPGRARAAAQADPVLDAVIDCDAWGARPAKVAPVLSAGTTQKIVVHHTNFPNTADLSRERAVALAHEIQDLHLDTRGFDDTGNHFTVSRGGYILEGRHRSLETLRDGTAQVIGAHAVSENRRSIGIESEGVYVTETPTQELFDAVAGLCVTVCRQYRLGAHQIFGHWDFAATLCPGAAYYPMFPVLRRKVAKELGTAAGDIPARTWPNIMSSSNGTVVATMQFLMRARGYVLTPDGGFGPISVAAVQDFQTRQGLPAAVGGEVGDATWERLVVPLDAASTGDPVTGLQKMLQERGHTMVTQTGVFDAATDAAVRAAQRLHGLPETGQVDTATWCAVVGGIVREEFAAAK